MGVVTFFKAIIITTCTCTNLLHLKIGYILGEVLAVYCAVRTRTVCTCMYTNYTISMVYCVCIIPLHSTQDRYSILEIHTQQWQPQLKKEFIRELSDLTVGYCGADLKALCTEAALYSLRRQYPQIYKTSDKLVIDVSKITITALDFYSALKAIVPTAQRSNAAVAQALSDSIFPLLGDQLVDIVNLCTFIFSPSWKCGIKALEQLKSRVINDIEKRGDIKKELARLRSEKDTVPSTDIVPVSDVVSLDGSDAHSNSSASFTSFQSNEVPPSQSASSSMTVQKSASSFVSIGTTVQKSKSVDSNYRSIDTSPRVSPSVHSLGTSNGLPGTYRDLRISLPSRIPRTSLTSPSPIHVVRSTMPPSVSVKPLPYQSADLSVQLDEIYFDISDMTFGSDFQPCDGQSISGSDVGLSADGRGSCGAFLSLSSHPHMLPPTYRPRLLLSGHPGKLCMHSAMFVNKIHVK